MVNSQTVCACCCWMHQRRGSVSQQKLSLLLQSVAHLIVRLHKLCAGEGSIEHGSMDGGKGQLLHCDGRGPAGTVASCSLDCHSLGVVCVIHIVVERCKVPKQLQWFTDKLGQLGARCSRQGRSVRQFCQYKIMQRGQNRRAWSLKGKRSGIHTAAKKSRTSKGLDERIYRQRLSLRVQKLAARASSLYSEHQLTSSDAFRQQIYTEALIC